MFNVIKKILLSIKSIFTFDLIPLKYLPMTQLFVIINIIVFILQILIPELTDIYVFRSDCWYSYITACFLHGNLGHLASNMLFLSLVFPAIEEKYGSLFIFLGYIITGAFGSAITALFLPESMGLGASGSIMGIMMIWIFHNLLEWRPFLVLATLLMIIMEAMKAGLQVIGFRDGIGHLAHFGSTIGAFFFLPIILWIRGK